MAVGGLDTELEVAYNDVDFCLKIRSIDLKVVADPEIVLFHRESKTRGADDNGARADRLAREAKLIREKWPDLIDNDPYYSPNLSLARDDFVRADPPRVAMPWRQG
jgi:GT2 family glycosyltransferase